MSIAQGLLDGLDSTSRDVSLTNLHVVMDAAMTDHGVVMPSQSWLIEANHR